MKLDSIQEEKERSFWSGRYRFLVLVILCYFLWAVAVPINKVGNTAFHLGGTDIYALFTFAGTRLLGAGVAALIYCRIKGIALRPSREELPGLIKLAMLMSVGQYVTLYIGTAISAGVVVSILASSGSFEGILFSSLVFKEDRLTVKKIIGCVLGLIAVVILNIKDLQTGVAVSILGSILIITSQASGTLGAVYLKVISQGRHAVWIGGWQSSIGGAVLLIVGLVGGGTLNFSYDPIPAAASTIGLMITSAAALIISNQLYKYNNISKVTIFSLLLPVFGALTSAVMLGESLASAALIVSLVLDCIGVTMVARDEKVPAKHEV